MNIHSKGLIHWPSQIVEAPPEAAPVACDGSSASVACLTFRRLSALFITSLSVSFAGGKRLGESQTRRLENDDGYLAKCGLIYDDFCIGRNLRHCP